MKRITSAVCLAAILSATPIPTLRAQQNVTGPETTSPSESPGTQGLWNSDDVVGANVIGPDGKKIGEVKQLIFDAANQNKVAFAIIGVGGPLSLGDSLVALPWSQLKYDKEKQFSTSVPEANLKKAPSFQKEKWMQFPRGDWDKIVSLYVPNYQPAVNNAPQSASTRSSVSDAASSGTNSLPESSVSREEAVATEQREAERRAAGLAPIAELTGSSSVHATPTPFVAPVQDPNRPGASASPTPEEESESTKSPEASGTVSGT